MMQTSSHYPSLFLLLNVHQARWYRVDENKVEELQSYSDEKDSFEDHEGQFGRGGGEPDVMNAQKKAEVETNFKDIAEKTAEIWKENGYEHLAISIHERYKNQFLDELGKAVGDVEPLIVLGNRIKAGKKEILELFKKSLQVI